MKIKKKIELNKETHSVRASQVVLQYGVGAMVDFPDQTLMTAAPEIWRSAVTEVHDERLEKLLNVDFFGIPDNKEEGSVESDGISYTRFPEWYFCPKCRSFKPLSEWKEEYSKSINSKVKKWRKNDPDMTRNLKCTRCSQDLVVARIVCVCECGHIDDFPWVKWTHLKNSNGARPICDNPELVIKTNPSSTEGLEGILLECKNCKAKASLKGVFDRSCFEQLDEKTGYNYNLKCSGRHPWNNKREKCNNYPKVVQRGSSSVYFPVTISSLVIPPYSSMLTNKIQNSVSYSDFIKSITDGIKKLENIGIDISLEIRRNLIVKEIENFTKKISYEIGEPENKIKDILERRWMNEEKEDVRESVDIKYKWEEYKALKGENELVEEGGDFIRESTNIEDYNLPYVKEISLIHKIREVQAMIGFSRLKPVEGINYNEKEILVNIKQKDTNWYPGYEVRGEGIFIEFDEKAIEKWRKDNIEISKRVNLINENYQNSYYGNGKDRKITDKFLLIHTISHLLMKQLSFECGYNIASLKERIYCSEKSEGELMNGILIYTASGDSEGTLGGLIRQGREDTFPSIYKKAIESAFICSNDPVCNMSKGQGRDSLNLSACYSCTLVPETSCSEFNIFLDRAMIAGTFEHPDIGFYSSYLKQNSNEI